MNVKIFLILMLMNLTCLGQQVDQLKITFQKSNADSGWVYDLSVKNLSDTTVCILHSMYVNLTSSKPQYLALYQQSKSKEYYSLHYSVSDTEYNYESLPYITECILPHQTLGFKIRINRAFNEKLIQLSFDYLYLPDFCYNNLLREMKEITTWYLKYKPKEKTLELMR